MAVKKGTTVPPISKSVMLGGLTICFSCDELPAVIAPSTILSRCVLSLFAISIASCGTANDLAAVFGSNRSVELQIQFPQGEQVLTGHDLSAKKYAFNRRTMVDAYKEVGDRNPKWDEQAIEFLDEVAKYFSGVEQGPCEKQVRQDGQSVMELGCTDPLVKYCHARMLIADQPSTATLGKAIQMVEEAYPLLVIRRYPANRCFAAADRLRRHYDDLVKKNGRKSDRGKEKKYFDECWRHSLQMILQDDHRDAGTLVIADNVMAFYRVIPSKVRGNYFFTAKKFEKQSPWLVNVIGGEMHIDKAWEGRGGGWGYDVTQEGWDEFGDHLRRAENCFTRAWKLTEDRPQPAAGMITVSMGAGENPNREMQQWFERAINAQLDYSPAYHRLLRGLMPRWHGSHQQMLQLGRLAMQTERFDTGVPYMLCEATWRVLDDLHNDQGDDLLDDDRLREDVMQVCRRYIDFLESQQCDTDWWQTVLLGFCYLTEQWDTAKELIDRLDKQLDDNALARFPLQRKRVVSEVLMRRGLHHERIAEAMQAIRDERRGEAIVAIESLLEDEDGDLDEDVVAALRDRLQAVRWEVAFEKGDEVDLATGDDLAGWNALAGKWVRRPTGAIRGEAAGEGLLLRCNANFGDRWILSGELVRGGSSSSKRTAGVYLYAGRQREHAVLYSPAYEWLSYGWIGNLSSHERPFRPKSDVVPFEIHFDRGTIDVWLDYRHLVNDYSLKAYDSDQARQIVLGTAISYGDAVLTYRNLAIRRGETAD